MTSTKSEMLCEGKPPLKSWEDESKEEGRAKIPDTQSHGLAKKKTQTSPPQPDFLSFVKASITQKDKEIWDRLKVSGETRTRSQNSGEPDLHHWVEAIILILMGAEIVCIL